MKERKEDSNTPFPVKLDDFFRLDYKTGSIYNQLTEKRAQVVPALPWSNLRLQITKKFGENGSAFLFETGFVIGATFGEEFMAYAAEPTQLVRRLCDLTSAAGWGTFAMIGDTRHGSQLNVVVANCIFCEGAGASETPVCDFLMGAIKGITDKVYGVPHKVYENRCIAMKDNICEVVVEEEYPAEEGLAGAAERNVGFEEARPEATLSERLIAELPRQHREGQAAIRRPDFHDFEPHRLDDRGKRSE
ncbi:MAG: 4-vinyl reductase [Thaumarchaeota archaeon]|nr:4-vinyl reductase [Nitrososphaerota archaeon]